MLGWTKTPFHHYCWTSVYRHWKESDGRPFGEKKQGRWRARIRAPETSALQSCEFEHIEHKMYWGEHTEGPNNTIATSVEYSTGLRRWNLAWNLRSREERRLTFSCQRLEPFWSPKFRWPICLGLKKLKLSVSWVTSIGVIVCTGSQVSDIAGVEVAVYFTVSRGDLLLKSTWIPISCVAARENCHGVVEVNAILWQRQGAKYHSHPAIQVKPATNFGLSYRGRASHITPHYPVERHIPV